jgi:small GTP-binding protein
MSEGPIVVTENVDKTKRRQAGTITRAIKCGIVGDGTVGKTTLLVSYTARAFLDDYVPTLFDNFSAIEEVDGQCINMILWDTAGQEDYTTLRTRMYRNTDIFLLCFSTVHMDSFDNLKHKWIIELKQNAPNTPFVLVGTKTDLREKYEKDGDKSVEIINTKKGQKRAKELKAENYVECTSKNPQSVNNVFVEAIRVIIERDRKRKIKDRKNLKKEEEMEKKMKKHLDKKNNGGAGKEDEED